MTRMTMVRRLSCCLLVGTLGAACGGGNHSNPPVEPNVTFACVGNVSDASGDSTPLPGGTSGTVAPLKKCAPASTTFSELVTECTTKCQNALSTYAQLINASLPPGTPPVQANQLTCNITNVTRAANDC